MSRRGGVAAAGGLALLMTLALGGPTPATAQLADEVAATREGRVRFAYPTRPGVEICDDGVRRMDDASDGFRRDRGTCWTDGMARAELQMDDGVVREVRLLRPSDMDDGAGPEPMAASAREAVQVLMAIVRQDGDGRAPKNAVFPAVVADVPAIWRELVTLARDRTVDGEARKASLFWLGQEAAAAVTAELSDVALAADEDREVREAAIFAISQRPAEEAIEALMEVGRDAGDAESRRQAMFWLAQFDDPRVVAFFQEVLSGRQG